MWCKSEAKLLVFRARWDCVGKCEFGEFPFWIWIFELSLWPVEAWMESVSSSRTVEGQLPTDRRAENTTSPGGDKTSDFDILNSLIKHVHTFTSRGWTEISRLQTREPVAHYSWAGRPLCSTDAWHKAWRTADGPSKYTVCEELADQLWSRRSGGD